MCSDNSLWFHCICVVANDIEHCFMNLFAISVTSLVKYLLTSFAHLLIELLLLLGFKNSFYILDIISLSDMLFASIFCLLKMMLISILRKQKLICHSTHRYQFDINCKPNWKHRTGGKRYCTFQIKHVSMVLPNYSTYFLRYFT